MKAPVDPADPLGTVNVAVSLDPNATYPVSETVAFPYREGAFYGNLFTSNLAAEVTVIPSKTGGDGTQQISRSLVSGSVYPEMYVCPDPGWTQAAAYATHRVCALPNQGANCAATVLDSCNRVCGTSDAAPVLGDGDYGTCKSPQGTLWPEPITVFLHSPCDLMLMLNGGSGMCSR